MPRRPKWAGAYPVKDCLPPTAYFLIPSRNLHLRRREDRRVVAGDGEDGQVDGANAPAMVFEHAPERRLLVDIADQANGRGVEVAGDLHLRFLDPVDDGLDGQVV